MARILDWSAWATNSLGIALLVIGLMLVPQSCLWADDPEEEPIPGTIACSPCAVACTVNIPPLPAGCTGRCTTLPGGVPCLPLCYCDFASACTVCS